MALETKEQTVVITDNRLSEAQEIEKYLTALSYDVRVIPESVCLFNEEEVSAFLASIEGDIAGVIHPAPPVIQGGIMELTEEQWNQAANEGPLSAFVVTKVFCERLKKQHHGAMIYLNSIHAEKPMGKGYLYSMGCGAVEMLSKEANQDYGDSNVNVFFLEAGPTEPYVDERKSDVSPIYYGVDMRYPLRKTPKSDYLNGLVAFLLTDAAYPMTGSPITCDGGYQGYYYHRHRVEGRPYYEYKRK